MKINLASKIQKDSIVDGPGLRAVIWTQGCGHKCQGCHNPSTHSFDENIIMDTKEIVDEILSIKTLDGVTFSGGDPMFQAPACNEIASLLKKNDINIWAYTGFTFEQLISTENKDILEFLSNIDILIDGKFLKEQKRLAINYRGSLNQRIIDVKSSLKTGEVVLATEFYEKERILKPKYENVYI